MDNNKLCRLFTLDTRKDRLPSWQSPILHQLIVDENNDKIYTRISHTFFDFSISKFPQFGRGDIDAVYIHSAFYHRGTGLLAIGGDDGSGSPPIKLYDTNERKFRWVMTSRSENFRARSAPYEEGLKRRYGKNILQTRIVCAHAIVISPDGKYIYATASESVRNNARARQDDYEYKSQRSFKKFNILGELLIGNDKYTPSEMVFNNNSDLLFSCHGNNCLKINSNTLDVLQSKKLFDSHISSLCLGNDDTIVCGTVEGEIFALDFDLNIKWSKVVDSMINCAKDITGLGIVVGTNTGDLIVFDQKGNVKECQRVTESIRDINEFNKGRCVIVGCKNMDLHVFINQDVPAVSANQQELEKRLLENKSSILTSTSSFTHGKIFISYSRKDLKFVTMLEKRMQEIGLSCWRDEHRLIAGRVVTQLKKAILENDILILVLSKNSIESDWVSWEVASAREQEKISKKDIICPISLDLAWKTWDENPILKREIEKYHIISFTKYNDKDNFEKSFLKLMQGLRENYLISIN